LKGGIFISYNQISSKLVQLKKEIANTQKKLSNFPEGTLICAQNGNSYKWYQTDGHTKTYIPKKNRKLAEQLAVKKYFSLMLEDLENEYLATQLYLQNHSPISKAEQLLTSPEYQNLLSSYFVPQSHELTNWMNSPYDRNPLYPEQCIHKSISGNLLRSKSESMIDMFLHIHKIPFRYECALHLEEITIYPDFTIRHPVTKEIYYWEHFGLMDSPTYSQNAYSKLQLYTSHDIIPSIQLITTFETKNHPLTSNIIENIIKQYFL